MLEANDIVERLEAPMPREEFFKVADTLCREAAALIRSLRAERDGLVGDLKRANELINAGLDDYRAAKDAGIAEGMERAAVIAGRHQGVKFVNVDGSHDWRPANCIDIESAIRAAKEVK